MKKAWVYETDWGTIGIAEEEGAVTNVFFGDTVKPQSYMEEETELLCRAAAQIREYLAGGRREFDLPLRPEGTDFEQRVWQALCTIQYGETRSYGQIAQQIGSPKACRAVGRANGRNPISILIPCHRVVGSDGRLTGYAGGLDKKKSLLRLEGASFREK